MIWRKNSSGVLEQDRQSRGTSQSARSVTRARVKGPQAMQAQEVLWEGTPKRGLEGTQEGLPIPGASSGHLYFMYYR
jgi:hypothetical protein